MIHRTNIWHAIGCLAVALSCALTTAIITATVILLTH